MIVNKYLLYEDRNDVNVTAYILDDSPEMLKGKSRPAVIICPGGAYLNCSDREAEPVAIAFMNMGYHAIVLRYSTYQEGKGGFPDPTKPMPVKEHCVYPNPMREIGMAMLFIHKHAAEWLVDTKRIALCGFSAGAHNCAMYAVNWKQPILTDFLQAEKEMLRPVAVILGYPLTDYCYLNDTMNGDPVAQGLFTISNGSFLGTSEPSEELLKEVSPVYHVDEDTPPCFLWATASDGLVAVQHSIRMSHALADHKVPFELHIFEEGDHGLSLANQTTAEAKGHLNQDVAQWITLAEKWLRKRMAYELPEFTDMELMMQQMQEQVKKSHQQVPSREYYQVTEILHGIYRITSAEAVYMELFVGEEKALLFDTGYGFGDLKGTIRKITDKPLFIVNSHGHLDHTCGNSQFDESVYIHPKDLELVREHTSKIQRAHAVELAEQTLDYYTNTTYNSLPLDFKRETYENGGCGNLTTLEDGQVFDLGGITLKVVELPGHTAGCIGLLYEEEHILYTGDSINACLWLFMPEALTLSEYKDTLKKAEQLPFKKMVHAHSDQIVGKDTLRYYMDAAETLDYETGEPYVTPLAPGVKAKLCIRDGKSMMNYRDPDFAGIVISKEHVR